MKRFSVLPCIAIALLFQVSALRSASAAEGVSASASLKTSTILNLDDVKRNPANYNWFDFRPNLKKLILSGAAETEHVAILWYTVANGIVGLHYHAKTESVYVIDGTQTDAKGAYPTGNLYFNPPGSGHAIKDSSGFFVLAYASPPDFAKTALIGEYTPIQIDTTSPELESKYRFEEKSGGVRLYKLPLDSTGGMSSELIKVVASTAYTYRGNYLLTLKGSCEIEGQEFVQGRLVVATTVQPQSYAIRASKGAECLALGVSF